ncbi:MAG TPA: GNAT family N-acetyltransferase [Clostridiales bacterium]|nr:GNAT family N-acetyltransferase [Clostridiales bacterium]
MKVEVVSGAKEFLESYEDIMLQQEAVSQLVLYLAYREVDGEKAGDGTFGAVMEGDTILLLFCNVIPHDLTIHTVLQEKGPEAAAVLADYILEQQVKIQGILGRKDVCQGFINQYQKTTEGIFIEKLASDIMELRLLNEIWPSEGIQRKAHTDEVKMIADWMIEFQMETLTSELDYEAALAKAEEAVASGDVYVFEAEDQKVVTMAVTTRRLPHGIAIDYVYTPEEYRGKGYAATNMYYLSKSLLAEGYQFCTLFVDKDNLLSHRAYEKVGYNVAGESYGYELIS